MEGHSEQAKKLLELLTPEEVLALRKNHPFKVDRNEKIRELHRRGVAKYLLAEVCGLRRETISDICGFKRKVDGHKVPGVNG